MSRVPDSSSTRSLWSPDSSSGAETVAARLRQLYGEVEWTQQAGVLHVAAVDAATGRVLVPGAFAPRSPVDRFVLGVSRARADAIVTTGAILRSEPDLRHDPGESPADNDALVEWRRAQLGRREAPLLIVLSGSGDFPLDHPALVSARAGTILTTEAGAQRLPVRVCALDVRIGDARETPIAGAIRVAREAGGEQTVAIEAGPSASAPLYAPVEAPADSPESNEGAGSSGLGCDELLLSRFEGSVDARALGPAFVDDATIGRVFGKSVTTERLEDGSGLWRFERYRRAATALA